MKPQRLFGFAAALFAFTFAFTAEAKITINPSFQGTLVITFPDGEISLLEAGDAIPDVPSGSTVEVFDGQFTLDLEAGDKVSASCLDHEITASVAGSLSLQCGEESGLLKVLKGSLQLTDDQGKQSELKEGTEYTIQLEASEKTAPPTAAGEALGGPPAGGDLAEAPPVDSRSLESSPQ